MSNVLQGAGGAEWVVGWEDGAAESPWYLRQPLSRHCPAASTGGADVYGLHCEGRPYHLLTACHCQEPSQALPAAPSAVSLPRRCPALPRLDRHPAPTRRDSYGLLSKTAACQRPSVRLPLDPCENTAPPRAFPPTYRGTFFVHEDGDSPSRSNIYPHSNVHLKSG